MADELEDDQWLYGETPEIISGDTANELQKVDEPSSEPQDIPVVPTPQVLSAIYLERHNLTLVYV